MAVIFTESFTGTNGNAWSTSNWTNALAPAGSSAIITSNVGRLTTGTGTAGGARVARRVLVSSTLVVDAVVLFKFRWPTGDECYPRWYVRSTNSSLDTQGGYFVELNRQGGFLQIGKSDGSYGGGSLPTGTSADNVAKSFAANTWYWVRFGVVGSALKARTWLDGTSEPNTWDIEVTDTQFVTGGSGTGITLGTGSIQNGKFEMDDVLLESTFPAITTELPTIPSSSTMVAPDVSVGYTVSLVTTGSTSAMNGPDLLISSTVTWPTVPGALNILPPIGGVGSLNNLNPISSTSAMSAPTPVIAPNVALTTFSSTSRTLTPTPTVPITISMPTWNSSSALGVPQVSGLRDFVRVGSANAQATYRDLISGRPCRGAVRFTPAAYISSEELLVPNRVTVQLDATGHLDVDLPVGKDQLTLPLVAYLVEELLGSPSVGRPPFYLLLTPGDDGSIVDLAAVPMEFEVPDLSLYMLKAGGEFTGPVAVDASLSVANNAAFGANVTVSDELTAGSLDVATTANVTSNMDVGGNVVVAEQLSAAYVSSPLYSGGTHEGDVDIEGQLHVSNDVLLSANTTVNGNFQVAGSVVGDMKLLAAVRMANTTEPTSYADGGSLYFQGGVPKFKGPDGVVHTLSFT